MGNFLSEEWTVGGWGKGGYNEENGKLLKFL